MTFAEHKAAQEQFRAGVKNRNGEERIGNAEVDADEVMDVDDLYDSERIAISSILRGG